PASPKPLSRLPACFRAPALGTLPNERVASRCHRAGAGPRRVMKLPAVLGSQSEPVEDGVDGFSGQTDRAGDGRNLPAFGEHRPYRGFLLLGHPDASSLLPP